MVGANARFNGDFAAALRAIRARALSGGLGFRHAELRKELTARSISPNVYASVK
jgi:hypothetical protein